MRAIFISYRRDDTEGHAGRLFEDLCGRFGQGSVFMDVAGIEPGRDFRRVIEQQVASCGVLLAVIGKNWLSAADAQGRPRLADPYDFVRLETASALKRDIPVIPVLVHQATMPRAEDLPDDLKELAFRNSVELTHARWSSDVQLLITALMPYVDPVVPTTPAAPATSTTPSASTASTHRRAAWLAAPIAALVVGAGGYVVWSRLTPAPATRSGTDAVANRGAASVADANRVAAAPSAVAVGAATAATASAAERSNVAAAASAAPAVARSATPAAAPPSTEAAAPAVVGARAASQPAHDRSASPQVPVSSSRRTDKTVIVTATPVAPPAPAVRPVRTPTTSAPVKPDRPAAPSESIIPTPPMVSIVPAPSSSPSPALTPTPAPSMSPSIALAPAPSPAPSSSPAHQIVATHQDPSLELFGSPGAVTMVTRAITIRPDTNYVNVTGGEVIRFDVGDKSFVWNFNGTRSTLDLSRVVPPTVLGRKVTAYIAPNPLYPRRQ